MLLLHWKCSIQ